MTKADFVKRLQKKLNSYRQSADYSERYRLDQIEDFVTVFCSELKEVVREGDELHINTLGKFYPKEMKARTVKGGFKNDGMEYNVPSKVKLGFSSFPSTDKHVSDQVAPREEDGLFSDFFQTD
jgi:nucleoid DNA-binding protein